MRIQPSPGVPREWYEQSSDLRLPVSNVCLKRVIKQVKKFKRDSLIHTGNSLLWALWKADNKPPAESAMSKSNFLVERYATVIISLAAIYSRTEAGRDATEVDFRILVSEFMLCPDSISFSSWQETSLIPKIECRLEGFTDIPTLKSIPKEKHERICADFFLVRLAAQQWGSNSFYKNDWIRAWLIYCEFRKIAISFAGCNGIDALEALYLGTTFDRFVRSAFSLYALVNADQPGTPPGFLNLGNASIPTDLTEKLGITVSDLEIVASRLSTKISTFPGFASDLEKVKEPLQKHCEFVDPFYRKPIIELDEYTESGKKILIPSPWKMMEATKNFLMHEFVEFLHENSNRVKNSRIESEDPTEESTVSRALAGRPAYSIRGDAFENYLRKTITENPEIIDLSVLNVGNCKRPDFIWRGDRYAILIEAKFRLGPNVDRKFMEPSSLLETWGTCLEAIEQASEFLASTSEVRRSIDIPNARTCVLVVVTTEPIPEERTLFTVATKRWSWLDNSGITAIALFAPAELEYWVLNSTADKLGEEISKVWNRIDPESLELDLRPDNQFNAIEAAASSPEVQAGLQTLFPGFNIQ